MNDDRQWPPADLAELGGPAVFVREAIEAGASAAIDGCDLYGSEFRRCEHGWVTIHIPPGGMIVGGHVVIGPGCAIRALPEGGVLIGSPCPRCPPGDS